jgi:hypothetical protein
LLAVADDWRRGGTAVVGGAFADTTVEYNQVDDAPPILSYAELQSDILRSDSATTA